MKKLLGIVLNNFIKKKIVEDFILINGAQIPLSRFVDFQIHRSRYDIEIVIICNSSVLQNSVLDPLNAGDKVQVRIKYYGEIIFVEAALYEIRSTYNTNGRINKYRFVGRNR